MISIQKGLENYKELVTTINGIKDINSLVELMYNNSTYDITNDLRENEGIIDVNYKNICATIKQKEKYLVVLPNIEVWDEDKTLDFINVNVLSYSRYNVRWNDNGELYIDSCRPYDDQDYYYIIENKVYRNGKYIETIANDKSNLDEIDVMILRLIELDSALEPKMCYN